MSALQSISWVGAGAYCLLWAEGVQVVRLGAWKLATQSTALGSSIITSTIGAVKGVKACSHAVHSLENVKKRASSKGLQNQNLVLLKLASDVAILAWAFLEVAFLIGFQWVTGPIRGGALALSCVLLTGSLAYEFYITGGWQSFQKKMDGLIHPLRERMLGR